MIPASIRFSNTAVQRLLVQRRRRTSAIKQSMQRTEHRCFKHEKDTGEHQQTTHVESPFRHAEFLLRTIPELKYRNKALFIVQPETLLQWHCQGFRLFWKYKSRAVARKPKISAETVALIKEMARDNRFWGAKRIRGELLKLGLRVCLPQIQKYVRSVRTAGPRGQNWKTFLRHSC